MGHMMPFSSVYMVFMGKSSPAPLSGAPFLASRHKIYQNLTKRMLFMGAFELSAQALCCDNICGNNNNSCNCNTKSEDCIIAYKIYDQCRIQECLTGEMIGPARAAENTNCCGLPLREGDMIVPPPNAAAVSIRDLELAQIQILSKTPNAVRCGYWDVEVKYVFRYGLLFRTSSGQRICCIEATSSYTMSLTLFGSTSTDVVVTNDMFGGFDLCPGTGPFVSVEGKAVALAAVLRYPKVCNNNCCCNNCCGCNNCGCNNCCCSNDCVDDCTCGCCYDENVMDSQPSSVCVTIGLYSIVKIFHQVNLVVPNCGICIPDECTGTASDGCPCDNFYELDFPMELFSPPMKCDNDSCCKK